MLSVCILINGNPLTARSCHNTEDENERGEVRYRVDDGSDVWHDPEDGVVALAKKLLDTIRET